MTSIFKDKTRWILVEEKQGDRTLTVDYLKSDEAGISWQQEAESSSTESKVETQNRSRYQLLFSLISRDYDAALTPFLGILLTFSVWTLKY